MSRLFCFALFAANGLPVVGATRVVFYPLPRFRPWWGNDGGQGGKGGTSGRQACHGLAPLDVKPGELVKATISWSEPMLKSVNRDYQFRLPKGYVHDKPYAVFIAFHGYGKREPEGEGKKYTSPPYNLGKLGDTGHFILVAPEGMNDCAEGATGQDCKGWQGWNGRGTTGSTASAQVCDTKVQTYKYCYASCQKKKADGCNPCDWASCYDDAGFVDKMLKSLEERFCVDRTRIFAWGNSAGGVFVHELPRRFPGRFAGIAATSGGKPHRGFLGDLPPNGPPIDVLMTRGEDDQIIPAKTPPVGTKWWDGYYYEQLDDVLESYKKYNGCKNRGLPYNSKFASGTMKCIYGGEACRQKASVVSCVFSGGHGAFKETGDDDIADDPQLAWEFFSRGK